MTTAENLKSERAKIIPQWLTSNFQALETALNGQKTKPLHKIRRQAYQYLSSEGLPGPRHEEWRYTNLSELAGMNFKLAGGRLSPAQTELAFELPKFDGLKIVFIDGQYYEAASDFKLSEGRFNAPGLGGVTFSVLEDDFETGSSQPLAEENPVAALNNAFLSGGLKIAVSAGQEVAKLIHLVYVSSAKEGGNFTVPRLVLNLDRGSSLNLVESFHSEGSEYALTSPLSEINLSANSRLNYFKLGLENESSYHLGNILLRQERDSYAKLLLFTSGGKLVRNEARVLIDGENASSNIDGLTILANEQHVDNHTVIDHALPNSESREKIKGIYGGRSRGVFSGTIIVRKDAQKTNAYQSNQTVLLSDQAAIDTKPQLKIWADDVKCTHGATVGQLDENALFYLRSRGLGKDQAKNLLVHAFASEVISEIGHQSLKNFIEERLTEKLSEL